METRKTDPNWENYEKVKKVNEHLEKIVKAQQEILDKPVKLEGDKK